MILTKTEICDWVADRHNNNRSKNLCVTILSNSTCVLQKRIIRWHLWRFQFHLHLRLHLPPPPLPLHPQLPLQVIVPGHAWITLLVEEALNSSHLMTTEFIVMDRKINLAVRQKGGRRKYIFFKIIMSSRIQFNYDVENEDVHMNFNWNLCFVRCVITTRQFHFWPGWWCSHCQRDFLRLWICSEIFRRAQVSLGASCFTRQVGHTEEPLITSPGTVLNNTNVQLVLKAILFPLFSNGDVWNYIIW